MFKWVTGTFLLLPLWANAAYVATDVRILAAPAGNTQPFALTITPTQVSGRSMKPLDTGGAYSKATIWNLTGNAIDLTPTTCNTASAIATNGTVQGGWGHITSINEAHAMMWAGTRASMTDLHPSGYNASGIYAISPDGTRQGGQANVISSEPQAMLWAGTAGSSINIHPGAAYSLSLVRAMDASQQGGYARPVGGNNRAAMWTGTAASFVDLQPDGYTTSQVNGVGNGAQVGYANIPFDPSHSAPIHAMLWRGTKESAVDLNPSWCLTSWANGTNGVMQVGIGQLLPSGSYNRAVVWNGTAESAIDLHSTLPANFIQSEAWTIAANGDIYGIAQDSSFRDHLIKWTSVPEPTVALPLMMGWYFAGRRRQSRQPIRCE